MGGEVGEFKVGDRVVTTTWYPAPRTPWEGGLVGRVTSVSRSGDRYIDVSIPGFDGLFTPGPWPMLPRELAHAPSRMAES